MIHITECPRDAMQGIKKFISTEYKIKYINQLIKVGFDTIDFGSFVSLIGSGGRIVFFGGTNGAWPSIKPQHLFFKQASILATTMGSPREFGKMCSFVETHQIVPVIDSIFAIDEHDQAFERLLHKDRFGKIVFDHGK